MDITLIRTFLEVARAGSYLGACERLFVTPAAVSLRIRRLEDSLGRPLFVRSKAGASLTPEGRRFEPYARSLLNTWDLARRRVSGNAPRS